MVVHWSDCLLWLQGSLSELIFNPLLLTYSPWVKAISSYLIPPSVLNYWLRQQNGNYVIHNHKIYKWKKMLAARKGVTDSFVECQITKKSRPLSFCCLINLDYFTQLAPFVSSTFTPCHSFLPSLPLLGQTFLSSQVSPLTCWQFKLLKCMP